jgi:hypothetical protein
VFRVMLILGLLVLVPAAIVFWRTRDRTAVIPSPPPPSVSQKSIGTSTLNHGDPHTGKGSDARPNRPEIKP